MALSLIVIGLLLTVAAAQNTQDLLFATVKSDFTGPDNFVQWIVAMFLVGALGYIPKMRGFSIALLALVLIAIFLRNGIGFFSQFSKAVGLPPTATKTTTGTPPAAAA